MVTAHFGTEMLDLNKSGNVRIGRSQFQAPESEHVMPAVITPCICGLNKSIRHSNSLKWTWYLWLCLKWIVILHLAGWIVACSGTLFCTGKWGYVWPFVSA